MKKEMPKIYRAKLDERRYSKVVGWPKPYHFSAPRKSFWQSLRAMLF